VGDNWRDIPHVIRGDDSQFATAMMFQRRDPKRLDKRVHGLS
jgi:hypothetical protein